jgi:hypothetical protein
LIGAVVSLTAVKPRRWVVALTLGWLAILVLGLAWALWRGNPTAREQTSVEQALPAADRALATVQAAATEDGQAVVYAGPFTGETCNVTSVRHGQRFRRPLTVVVNPGTEQALLERIAARLPASYHAFTRAGTSPRLYADAGFYVSIVGTISAPGQVRFVADTGNCRPGSNVEITTGGGLDEAPVNAALLRLGLSAQQWDSFAVACPGGKSFVTTQARTGEVALKNPLSQTLQGTPGTVVSSPELYAYTVDGDGVAIRTENGRVVVTSTTNCPQ